MDILVIGGGGREHAIVTALKKSARVGTVYCAPSNAGINSEAEPVEAKVNEFEKIAAFLADHPSVEMTVVAPDNPLADGLVNYLGERGHRAFGPTKEAAIIEASKAFSKDLMKLNGIPTAKYETFKDHEEALEYVRRQEYPLVIKADGLALGKGVIICQNLEEAEEALIEIMLNEKFGKGNTEVIVEEFLVGREVSILSFTDGKTIVPMLSSQDHKKAFDGDLGPNTGGMGAFCPSPYYTPDIAKTTYETIMLPTMHAMNKLGRTFKGVLYFGLMMTEKGVSVLEYNARFGDPETQAVLPLLKTDLVDIMEAVIDERLDEIDIEWSEDTAVTVVAASDGYPGNYEKGKKITIGDVGECKVYHAGTALNEEGDLVTNGGRVLALTAIGSDIPDAREKAYAAMQNVSFEGMFYRTDIGLKPEPQVEEEPEAVEEEGMEAASVEEIAEEAVEKVAEEEIVAEEEPAEKTVAEDDPVAEEIPVAWETPVEGVATQEEALVEEAVPAEQIVEEIPVAEEVVAEDEGDSSIFRIFVEKKVGFDIPAKRVKDDLSNVLKVDVKNVRMFLRYDVDGLTKEEMDKAIVNVFSEPPCDTVYREKLPSMSGYRVFGVEFLRGQYDQRADSSEQCVELLLDGKKPLVRTATIYAVETDDDAIVERIRRYLVNPTDSKLCEMKKPRSLEFEAEDNSAIEKVEGFLKWSKKEMEDYHSRNGFAMSLKDLLFVRDYFKGKRREPTVTELKVIDTYWSDHCRHTTFLTELKNVDLGDNAELKKGYQLYQSLFKQIYAKRKDKYVCLMDVATIGTKALKAMGRLTDLDESEEINACSVKVQAKLENGTTEDWLVMFKNETHNHPTEIEPFGGAATCLGGAIRDPLSGRVYVYQAMRITGAGDVFQDVSDTMPGKLPQRVISKTATAGFSSYGNQIGLAAGIVHEVYHPNYVAKRLETGFVIGAAPAQNVVRERPVKGDMIILLGGETGRDGCGGATGSSKAHNVDSVTECGAEVQKGNPLTERKIQRFFRNEKATRLIKKCNDFGAGGVAVAIGELADGLDIYLEKVPKKYKGLTVTEIAISESQERMAVVVAKETAREFLRLVKEENLSGTVVAKVTDTARMRMFLNGATVVDIERKFLDTNGVRQTADVKCRTFRKEGVTAVYGEDTANALSAGDYTTALKSVLADPNMMIQKGLQETFDSSIGAGSVLAPFGGKYQLTPAINMAARLPMTDKNCRTVSLCSWAFDPAITEKNPYAGGQLAVLASVSKLVAGGANPDKIRLTLQEFFRRMNGDPKRFGEPFAALLGALNAQINLHAPAIGGKDSMSGSFEDIDVPNTLISFAMACMDVEDVKHNVFNAGQTLYRVRLSENGVPDYAKIADIYNKVYQDLKENRLVGATVTERGGAIGAIVHGIIGNKLGVRFTAMNESLFTADLGDLILAATDFVPAYAEKIAEVTDDGMITGGVETTVEEALDILSGHEKIYPTTKESNGYLETISYFKKGKTSDLHIVKPKVFIPVFPGTNCEYDTAKRFLMEGAEPQIFVVKNGNSSEIAESVKEMEKLIRASQILMFPGGFSGGDEPDGSGKFIATTFRNPYLQEAVADLLEQRDGLALGICNGFQALIKLGLLPHGKITPMKEDSPTLTFNTVNRHVATVVRTRIATTASPWLSDFKVGDVFAVPISHGEGRFTANDSQMEKIVENGQIATQYVDFNNNATMASPYNPNGSRFAVEGLISENGRVFGKMGHTERYHKGLYQNLDENFDMNIFRCGVKYFK